MGYKLPKEYDAESIYTYLSKKKRWVAVWGEEIPSKEQKDLIKECMDMVSDLTETSITRLANLVKFATVEEVRKYWGEEAFMINNKLKRRPAGPSLENFVQIYGHKKGSELYEEYTNKRAEINNSNGGSVFCVSYYTQKGYSEADARKIIKERNSELANRRWDQIREQGICTTEYTRSLMPHSKDYRGYVGLSEEEAEALRQEALKNCIRDRAWYIETYGEEEAKIRLEDRRKRRYATMMKNGTGIFNNTKGMASSWSLALFLPLAEWLHGLGYTHKDIQMGLPEYRGERWIRYGENKYYLYDFCFLPANVIIEYHGVEWHPKPDGTWVAGNPAGVDGKEKRKQDEHKLRVAKEAGYKIIEVWSDEDLDDAIERCKEFIESYRNSEVQD